MLEIMFIPQSEFSRVRDAGNKDSEKLRLLADMCRFNAFSAVKTAGSGHLGTSFSAMDIFIWLYYKELNTLDVGLDSTDRDIFFSSKGHDAPGLYSVLHSLRVLSFEKLLMFRRLGGLDGHPDVGITGVEANTGSLGMGISKAKGMAWAKDYLNYGGRLFVMTGDGELQEGQIFESLQTTFHQGVNNLTVIVDHNKVQSSHLVENIISLGALEAKIKSFGWHVERCNGNDFGELEDIFSKLNRIVDKPKLLIADTVKGAGISFMEHPTCMETSGHYKWHAGAPDDDTFKVGAQELAEKISTRANSMGLEPIEYVTKRHEGRKVSSMSSEFVAHVFTDALIEEAEKHDNIVLLDADLSGDAQLERFSDRFPSRFIQNGIAEQDMVSTAGGLALQGMIPVVNSFASFLSSRSNEQIYNNATEETKIIYACLYAGLIPAGPGKSHQSLRDIALLGSLPNITIIHPANAEETRAAVKHCVENEAGNCAIRLTIGPSPRLLTFEEDYRLQKGKGTIVSHGTDAVLFTYGPVMLNEALKAADALSLQDVSLRVINMPWLNSCDLEWLYDVTKDIDGLFFLEDHGGFGGLADYLTPVMAESGILSGKIFSKFSVEGFPACGTPVEVLQHHGLDGESVASKIKLRLSTANHSYVNGCTEEIL